MGQLFHPVLDVVVECGGPVLGSGKCLKVLGRLLSFPCLCCGERVQVGSRVSEVGVQSASLPIFWL